MCLVILFLLLWMLETILLHFTVHFLCFIETIEHVNTLSKRHNFIRIELIHSMMHQLSCRYNIEKFVPFFVNIHVDVIIVARTKVKLPIDMLKRVMSNRIINRRKITFTPFQVSIIIFFLLCYCVLFNMFRT